MRIQYLLLLALLCSSAGANAQTDLSPQSPPLRINGGYSWLSNSFNGVPGSHHALSGWEAGAAFPQWHHLRFKLDYSMYRGTNLGDPQHAFFILGGAEYGTTFHRERFFAEGLLGEGGLNGTWFNTASSNYKNGNSGMIASLAEFLGGGADTPVGPHTAIRIEGGVQHTNFDPIRPLTSDSQPYHLAGIPNYFGRLSAGVVWIPRLSSAMRPAGAAPAPVESEIVFEGMNSLGHFHLFANSWWSYLSTAGIEYDRHSWGRLIGADVDYSAEFLPVMILRQPSKTDIWGNRLARTFTSFPGVGILPIGMRLIWNDEGRVKPYYVIKAGVTVYSHKAFSQDASYENLALDQSLGVQFRLSGRTDFRTGFGVFHQSNGFVVPSNPGLDEMNWNVGVSYHLGRSQPGY